jgi:methionyl-tRNA formyltransferase
MNPLRIVFMGSPDFAVPSLRILHSSRHQIVCVLTGSDKRRGRGSENSPTQVKKAAQELGIPVLEADDLKSPDLIEKLHEYSADLFVVVAFRILPGAVLKVPSVGSINLHASLLPAYRGAAPIHHAVMNGETETGCTVFFLDELVDTGNILLQEKITIAPDETTGSVYSRLMHIGAGLLLKAVNLISEGDYELIKQDERLASKAPKIFPDDCRLNFYDEAVSVYNKIRGLSPFPGAWAMLDEKRFRILEAQAVTEIPNRRYSDSVNDASANSKDGSQPRSGEIVYKLPDIDPGEIVYVNGQVFVGCTGGALKLLKVQLEGKKIMDAGDFFRGYKWVSKLK